MTELVDLRRLLHSQPDLSDKEESTSKLIRNLLDECGPDDLITDLGGFGVAAIFNGEQDGPRVMIRCELDALPIPETIDLPYGSKADGIAHKCGHDGHMTIAIGLARRLQNQRPAHGSVLILFQPSEETGEGAERVINDEGFLRIAPDYAFALHNLPRFPLGQVVVSDGVFASASRGLIIRLQGATSHAAEPESGNSPALAIAHLIEGISSLPQFHSSLHQAAQATVIHARLGEIAFGTSPGEGVVMATLRSHSEDVMETLSEEAVSFANRLAEAYKLDVSTEFTQVFPSTHNDSNSARLIKECAERLGMETTSPTVPFAWSEDFGHFTARYKGALFGLGAGADHPALHHPDYDFPEKLIQPGIDIFSEIISRLLG